MKNMGSNESAQKDFYTNTYNKKTSSRKILGWVGGRSIKGFSCSLMTIEQGKKKKFGKSTYYHHIFDTEINNLENRFSNH